MTKCPKDADFSPYDDKDGNPNWCHMKHSIWYCSRRKNHKGKHHAHSYSNHTCHDTWTTEEALIEAL